MLCTYLFFFVMTRRSVKRNMCIWILENFFPNVSLPSSPRHTRCVSSPFLTSHRALEMIGTALTSLGKYSCRLRIKISSMRSIFRASSLQFCTICNGNRTWRWQQNAFLNKQGEKRREERERERESVCVCACVRLCFFILLLILHAPLLEVILHALLISYTITYHLRILTFSIYRFVDLTVSFFFSL